MPFPVEAIALYEEVYAFDSLDILATFRVRVEQMPGRPWRITDVDGKSQDGSWIALDPGTFLCRTFRMYAQHVYPQAILDALAEAQAAATEATRNDAGDVRVREVA